MRKLGLLLVVMVLLSVLIAPMAQDDMELPAFITDARTPCEVDLTGESIQFWHIGDLTGTYSFITGPFVQAFADAASYFNAHGGICGAEITVPDPTTIDTAGNQEQTQIIYDRVSAENPKFILLYASGDSELLRDQLAEDEIVSLISAGSIAGLYGEDGNSPGWVFATNPLYIDQFGHFCRYISENSEQFPDPVIGYISWPGAFGEAAYTPESIAYCESLGVNVLDEADGSGPELFLPTDSDISGSVQNLVDAGANILYTNTLATGPALVAATVTNLGLNDQVQVSGVNWVLDTSVGLLGLQSIGPNGLPSVNGMIGSLPFVWWTETDNPGVQLVIEQADLNERPITIRNIAYIGGWQFIEGFIEINIQAANAAGGLDYTGADLKAIIETMDYEPLQLLHLHYDEGVRDLAENRMAVLTYAGVDGGTVLDGQAPMTVDMGNGTMIPVTVFAPLEDFRDTPDLRPGGADVVE
jgi:ABC-type branched-subunit amino acid transport system substrate-binding protein